MNLALRIISSLFSPEATKYFRTNELKIMYRINGYNKQGEQIKSTDHCYFVDIKLYNKYMVHKFYVFCMYFYITGLSEGWRTPRIDYHYQYFSYFLIIFFFYILSHGTY